MCLQSQIAAKERCNIDLATSNTNLRKPVTELGEEKKELSVKVVELKSRNEKLEDRNVELIKESAMQSSQFDSLKKELANEKAENVAVKAKLESTLNKMKFIAIDAILHAWAKLMEEFKKGEHISWGLDQEIQTWKDREVVLARGEEEETDEDESTPMPESPNRLSWEIVPSKPSMRMLGPRSPLIPW